MSLPLRSKLIIVMSVVVAGATVGTSIMTQGYVRQMYQRKFEDDFKAEVRFFSERQLQRLSTDHLILIAAMLLAPFGLFVARAHPLATVAAVMIASGIVGAVAAYYGDSIEIGNTTFRFDNPNSMPRGSFGGLGSNSDGFNDNASTKKRRHGLA